ncbi:hypothetical protein GGH96_006027 [Coemansia sp. RSA 1972]|nr:hypothetical protein GGH96_006027 [Coemansia sp. RSA 1972]
MELRPYASLVDTASYMAKAMLSDYSNNVMLRYGSTLQGTVNMLLQCQQRQKKLVDELEAEENIWGPAHRLKESLSTGQPDGTSKQEEMIIGLLQPVLNCYSVDYEFAEQSIFYDMKVHPLQHLKAFVCLNMILARKKMWCVQALLLRRSWIYAHVPLNTAILVRCIFQEKYTSLPGGKKTIQPHIIKYWGRAVDLKQDMFRLQKGHQFLGFVMTDRVSISAVRETKEELAETSSKHAHGKPQQQVQGQPAEYQPLPQQPPVPVQQQQQQQQQKQKQADCAYISELSQEQLRSTAGRCVLVDPGRQDLLFMLHEKSTVDNKNVYRYTRNQQHCEMKQKKYQTIRKHVKKVDVVDITALEHTLKAGSFTKPDLALFEEYLAAQAKVEAELTDFHNETMYRQRDGTMTPMVPLHHKLRLLAYINQQRADQLLMNWLKKRFSQDAVFILGNWGAPMTKFHEPIHGKGWRTLLKCAGFDVYLIDEYLTSKTCPICEERISTFHKVKNPRPWMRTKRPMVKCYGLLGCQSQTCMEFFDTYDDERGYLGKQEDKKKGEEGRVKWRLWNRDLAAVLNFRKILFSLRETGTVPTCFQRKQQPTEAPKTTARKRKQPTDMSKTTARKTTAPAAPAPHPN